MLLLLALARCWAGVLETGCNMPHLALRLAGPSAWYFPLAGHDEAGSRGQCSVGKSWLGLQDS